MVCFSGVLRRTIGGDFMVHDPVTGIDELVYFGKLVGQNVRIVADKVKAQKPRIVYCNKPGSLPHCVDCPFKDVSTPRPELGCNTYYEGDDVCPYVLMDLYD